MSCCARPWFCKTIEEFQEECSRWLPFNAFAIYNWYGQLINDCIKLLNDNGYFSPDLKPLTCISY
jgi:hypothetical protein